VIKLFDYCRKCDPFTLTTGDRWLCDYHLIQHYKDTLIKLNSDDHKIWAVERVLDGHESDIRIYETTLLACVTDEINRRKLLVKFQESDYDSIHEHY
jgi:hypothetical protein